VTPPVATPGDTNLGDATVYQRVVHRRSQDFVWWGALYSSKSWRPFFTRRLLKTVWNY